MSDGVPEPIAVAPLDVGVDADLVDGDPLVHFGLGYSMLLPPGFHYPAEDVDVGVGHGGVVDRAMDTFRMALGWAVFLLKFCRLGKEHVLGCGLVW